MKLSHIGMILLLGACSVDKGEVSPPVVDPFILNASGTYKLIPSGGGTPLSVKLVSTLVEGQTYKVGDIVKLDNTVIYEYNKQYTDTSALYKNIVTSKYNVVNYDKISDTLEFLGDFKDPKEANTAISAGTPINPSDDAPTPTPPLTHSGVIKSSQLTIHGQHVPKEALVSKYGRLPKSLEDSTDQDLKAIKTHGLNTDSAGLYIAFETDAKSIAFSFTLKEKVQYSDSAEANNSTENAFDLYSLENGKWESVQAFHLLANAAPYEVKSTYNNASGTTKKYILLFPLYNGVADKEFTLTIPKEAKFYDSNFFGEDKRKHILIYGTSITQGANPSKVGLAYTSRLLFDQKREIINMGFSGNALMCKDITDYVTDIPSAVFFIDPTMNMGVWNDISRSKVNAEYMIKTYRKKHPKTPIVVVSQFDGTLTSAADGTEGAYGQAMKEVVEKLKAQVGNLHFLARDNFIPKGSIRDSNEPDNIHPGDEGMEGYANKYNEILKTIKPDESK